MPTIDIFGVTHFYELTEARSEKPVLVFVHGWLLSGSYWQPLIELLSEHYQCLSYDLRGFGKSLDLSNYQSETLDTQYSLAAYAQDLEFLLDQLNIKQAWVIGHSLGGSIALWIAQNRPAKIQGVFCLNAGGGIYLPEEFERFRNAGKQLVKFRPQWLKYIPIFDFVFARMMVKRPLEMKWGHQRLLDFLQADSEAALGSLLESTTESEVNYLPKLVSQLQQPVYFLAGAQDSVMELQYVQYLASFHHLYEDNLFVIPDCGHFAMLEHTTNVRNTILEILA